MWHAAFSGLPAVVAAAVPGPLHEVYPESVVSYAASEPAVVAGMSEFDLLPGDVVTIDVEGVPGNRVIGRSYRAAIRFQTERETGKKSCKKQIERITHTELFPRQTEAVLFQDFAPQIAIETRTETTPVNLAARRYTFVAQRQCQLRVQPLRVSSPNLVLTPGAAPTSEERDAVRHYMDHNVRPRSKTVPELLAEEVLPGATAGLQLRIRVQRGGN